MKRIGMGLAIAVLAGSILSGCVVRPVDGYYGGQGNYEGQGYYYGEHGYYGNQGYNHGRPGPSYYQYR
jgi:hypothetical protein